MLTTLLILQSINVQRLSFGLSALRDSPVLDRAAQAKVEDEVKHHYFAHYSPSGKCVWDFVGFNNDYTVIGENLAEGYNDVPSLVNAWMKSPTHRANILDSTFTWTGIGVVVDHGTILVSEDFAD